jgi:hypothetical protein
MSRAFMEQPHRKLTLESLIERACLVEHIT